MRFLDVTKREIYPGDVVAYGTGTETAGLTIAHVDDYAEKKDGWKIKLLVPTTKFNYGPNGPRDWENGYYTKAIRTIWFKNHSSRFVLITGLVDDPLLDWEVGDRIKP